MKKLFLGIVVLTMLYCNVSLAEISLGDLKQFFAEPSRVWGSPSVKITSKTPKSIKFWYKNVYVNLGEVTNAAQHHCEKSNRDAILFTEEELGYGGEMKAGFICQ